jgi:hypothetical protein
MLQLCLKALRDGHGAWLDRKARDRRDNALVVEPGIFVDRAIAHWPSEFVVYGDDLILWVGRSGDDIQQDVRISLLSSGGYSGFLYENQKEWLSGDLDLPRIHTNELRSGHGESGLATSIESVALDVAAIEREFDEPLSCLCTPYRVPEELRPNGVSYLGQERLQTYLKTLAETIRDREMTLSAFRPGGLVATSLAVWEPMLSVIFLGLRTGREPDAIVECLQGFDMAGKRGAIEELVQRAHRRFRGADSGQAAAGMRQRLAVLRRRWAGTIRNANPIAVAVLGMTAFAGWIDASWAWVIVGAGLRSVDRWPSWRKSLAAARHIDTEIGPPASFRAGIGLLVAAGVLGTTLLCALVFALGRGVALVWGLHAG